MSNAPFDVLYKRCHQFSASWKIPTVIDQFAYLFLALALQQIYEFTFQLDETHKNC